MRRTGCGLRPWRTVGRVGSRSEWTAVPMAETSAEAAQSPAHGQARRLYRNPHCSGSFRPREARADRRGQLTKNFREFKGDPFGKANFLPFAPRRDPAFAASSREIDLLKESRWRRESDSNPQFSVRRASPFESTLIRPLVRSPTRKEATPSPEGPRDAMGQAARKWHHRCLQAIDGAP
jgi:hypothetical protein